MANFLDAKMTKVAAKLVEKFGFLTEFTILRTGKDGVSE